MKSSDTSRWMSNEPAFKGYRQINPPLELYNYVHSYDSYSTECIGWNAMF